MTNGEKKRWLMEYRRLEAACDALIDERARWMSRAAKVTPVYTDLPRSTGGDRVQTAVDHLAEIDAQIGREIEAIERRRARTVEAIRSVADARLRTLLKLRYIDGYKWEEIAVKMMLDYRWVLRLHGKALSNLTIESHPESVL